MWATIGKYLGAELAKAIVAYIMNYFKERKARIEAARRINESLNKPDRTQAASDLDDIFRS